MQLNYKVPSQAHMSSPPKHNGMYLVNGSIPITYTPQASLTECIGQATLLHHHNLTVEQSALCRHYGALWNRISLDGAVVRTVRPIELQYNCAVKSML